jgi:DNA-binding transcriptional ArsR family regulator
MLHFHLLDILDGPEGREGLSITGLMDELSERLSDFEDDSMPDESTVRKKLREYASLGLVELRKKGRETIYRRSEDRTDLASWDAAAAFFQEAAPLGVIGSFLRDRMPERFQKFRFKHHYILNALDSEILYDLFAAIRESRMVTLTVHKRQQITVLPLRIYIGTQTGRQYLLACSPSGAAADRIPNVRFTFYRADLIDNVKTGEKTDPPEDLSKELDAFTSHVWGVAGSNAAPLQHIEMTVLAGPGEDFIVQRLEREKSCGMNSV